MSVRSKPNREGEAPAEPERDAGELPEGWAFSKLGDLATFINGDRGKNYPSKGAFVETGIPFINAGHLRDGAIDLSEMNYISEERFRLLGSGKIESDDILYCLRGSLGKAAIVRGVDRGAIASSLVIIRPIENTRSEYLYYFLVSPLGKDEILKYDNGSAQPNLSAKSVQDYAVPIPPLAEQQRIVGKLELLLGKVSSSQQRLSRVPGLLKRFRQSVLAAACSGKLTADWREENPQPALTVSDAEDIGSGIPESWAIATVRDVIDGLKYGTSQKCDYSKTGIPVLRIPNIAAGAIDHSDMKYAELQPAELEQLRLRAGDVLLIRSNGSVSLVGKTALVRDTEQDFAYAGYLIRLRPDRAKITPEFLNAVLGSYDVRLQIEIPARSTSGVNNINSEEVRALRIPLPPLSEQQEIVRRVEKLFAFADQIESRLRQAQAHVDRLTQSLLAKAFRGELVPTEAALAAKEGRDYETAETLLTRIRATSQEESTKPSQRRKGQVRDA